MVTGVLARVSPPGMLWLRRRLPKGLARDLDDSKNLVSFKNATLGEAWARALVPAATSPAALFSSLSMEDEPALRARCPKQTERQCWTVNGEAFEAEPELVTRTSKHLERMRQRGVEILGIKSEVLCAKRLNDEKLAGGNRFVSDLNAMERLILAFREQAGAPLLAHCGKVGGMADYDRFFGPLSGRLRTTLRQGRDESAYHFPGLGRIHFIKDADGRHPLVMLASLVGKYLRELLMARISQFYTGLDDRLPQSSGYHDPVTARLVRLSIPHRRQRGFDDACFERLGAN